MRAEKTKNKKQVDRSDTKPDLLWRKPITLDVISDDDPLTRLYRGREVDQPNSGLKTENQFNNIEESAGVENKPELKTL